MDNTVTLYAYGKSKTDGAWWIDSSKVVNRLYYVIGGSAIVKCSGSERTLLKGNIYILPQIGGFQPINSENFEHIFFDYYSVPALHPDSFTEISGTVCDFDQLFSFINSAISNHEIDRHSALCFLRAIISIINNNVTLEYINDSVIIKSLDLIYKNKTGITTKELARQVNLNESYFIRLFSRIVGTTPMKYSRSYRLSEGRLLMKNGYTVAEAAEMCGYMTPAAFWKAIHSEFGCAPGAFKKHK